MCFPEACLRSRKQLTCNDSETWWEGGQIACLWTTSLQVVDLGVRRNSTIALVGWVVVIELRLPVCRQIFRDWKCSARAFAEARVGRRRIDVVGLRDSSISCSTRITGNDGPTPTMLCTCEAILPGDTIGSMRSTATLLPCSIK